MAKIHIIGAGLAGSEAAWQCAQYGLEVILYEMRPHKMTPAHQGSDCAELVCSNSFRSDDSDYNAVGLLHHELRVCDSVIMACGDAHSLPAGAAMAVDRNGFSQAVTQKLQSHSNITFCDQEITALPDKNDDDLWLIATGPLTSDSLSQSIIEHTSSDHLAFFDAIAPIIYHDTIDFSKAWMQSRYDKGDGKDYVNCPLNQQQYENFINALINGDYTQFKDWERDTPYFESCLPIEVMAQRGTETLRYGPMKPVGLTNPHSDEKPYAVVQLRQDNQSGSLWNMVGFQTKLKHGAQIEIFRTIPALENAEFARLGGIHRNSFIKTPALCDDELRLKTAPYIRFAGQITGVEGYVESCMVGLMAAYMMICETRGQKFTPPPPTTSSGALLRHITQYENIKDFQPMNANFGLFDPLNLPRKIKGRDRKYHYCQRAKQDFNDWRDRISL